MNDASDKTVCVGAPWLLPPCRLRAAVARSSAVASRCGVRLERAEAEDEVPRAVEDREAVLLGAFERLGAVPVRLASEARNPDAAAVRPGRAAACGGRAAACEDPELLAPKLPSHPAALGAPWHAWSS